MRLEGEIRGLKTLRTLKKIARITNEAPSKQIIPPGMGEAISKYYNDEDVPSPRRRIRSPRRSSTKNRLNRNKSDPGPDDPPETFDQKKDVPFLKAPKFDDAKSKRETAAAIEKNNKDIAKIEEKIAVKNREVEALRRKLEKF